MSTPVLLLDAAWRVDRVIGVEHACEMLLGGRVIAASEDIAKVMHSPSIEVAIPSVVARTGRLHAAEARPPLCSARRVRQRDGHLCQFVIDGEPCDHRGDSVDHLRPASHGGPGTWSNLVAACRAHNQIKADRTLSEMQRRHGWALRRTPYVPTRAQLLVASISFPQPAWQPYLVA